MNIVPRVLIAVASACLLAMVFLPLDITCTSNTQIVSIAVLRPPVDVAIWYSGIASVPLWLIASLIYLKKRMHGRFALCLGAVLLAFPLAASYRIARGIVPFTICSTSRGLEGKTYTYLDRSFLQGQELALGQKVFDSWLYQHFRCFGTTNGDSPRSYLLIVRPVDKVRETYGQLHWTMKGLLLGLRDDNKCYFAYDYSKKRFIGREEIEGLSPFLLVDTRSLLFRDDIESIIEAQGESHMGRPSRAVLTDAMTHENKAVQAAVAEMLSHYDD